MGAPAVVAGDQITGLCSIHLIPNPASGVPQPSPPLPFASPLTTGLATTVTIGGRPAAVQGSTGTNTPPHVGLHPTDPFLGPPTQQGQVMMGSTTVSFDGRPAAFSGCTVAMCASLPGTLTGTAATVQVGP